MKGIMIGIICIQSIRNFFRIPEAYSQILSNQIKKDFFMDSAIFI